MGMVKSFITVSEQNAARILESPAFVWRLLWPDNPEMYFDALKVRMRPTVGIGKRLLIAFGLAKAPPQTEPTLPPLPVLDLAPGEGVEVSVDKAWHGIHFLLTGTDWEGAWPECFMCLGGSPMPGEIPGPDRRLFNRQETAEVADMLGKRTPEDLRTRYDPDKMTELGIYPSIWKACVTQGDPLEYLVQNYEPLRNHFQRAKEGHFGMIISEG